MKINTPSPSRQVGGGRVIRRPGRRLENWLQTYARYTADSEASPLFHLWAGLGALSAVTGRQISMNMGKFSYLTNLYTVLVGPPGSKKTTAMMTARGLVKQVPGIHIGANVTSPEAIVTRLSKINDNVHQSLMVYSLELGTFLGKGETQRHMTDFLCDFYDGNPDFEKETQARGSELITLPWFAFQACTVPEWLQSNFSSSALEAGFFSRTLWVYNDERRLLHPWPEVTPAQVKMREDLLNDLIHISTLEGEFTASQEAREFYSKWYMDPRRFPEGGERLGGYYDRKHVHLMKIAMLLSLAEGDSLRLEKRDFETGLALLNEIEPDMHRAFIGVGRNPLAVPSERVLETVLKAGTKGVPKGLLVAAHYHSISLEEMNKILDALRISGRIKILGTTIYPP